MGMASGRYPSQTQQTNTAQGNLGGNFGSLGLYNSIQPAQQQPTMWAGGSPTFNESTGSQSIGQPMPAQLTPQQQQMENFRAQFGQSAYDNIYGQQQPQPGGMDGGYNGPPMSWAKPAVMPPPPGGYPSIQGGDQWAGNNLQNPPQMPPQLGPWANDMMQRPGMPGQGKGNGRPMPQRPPLQAMPSPAERLQNATQRTIAAGGPMSRPGQGSAEGIARRQAMMDDRASSMGHMGRR